MSGTQAVQVVRGPWKDFRANEESCLRDWELFWDQVAVSARFESVGIPSPERGIDGVIGMPEALTIDQMVAITKRFVLVQSCMDNFGRVLSERAAGPAYALRMRPRGEADEELCLLSADALRDRKIACMNAVERLAWGLKFFLERGEHLDSFGTYTLCPGSRTLSGQPLKIGWSMGRLTIGVAEASHMFPNLRGREILF